jgi:hypothetical protein
MFSLQKLLGKEDRFFTLLEGAAQEARASVQSIVHILKTPVKDRNLDQFVQARRKEKKLAEQITEELCRTFVTALEREDIEALSHALYRIPKTAEKFGERLLLVQHELPVDLFSRQVTLLEQATETLIEMVKELHRGVNLEKTHDQNARLQQIEGQADKVILELLRDLYSGKHDALRVIILKDLYELLEKMVDRCRDAANVIFQIVLKHS